METKITFEEYLRKENLSENTITSYLWTVNYFNVNYDVVSKENLLAYKGYLMEFFKPKTVNLRIQAINKYLEYLEEQQLQLKAVKVQQKNFLENVISNADYNFLKKQLKKDSNMEWYFVVWYLAATGARVSELIQIKIEHIEIGYFDLYTKGGKLRRLYIPQKLKKETLEWLKEKHRSSGYLFLAIPHLHTNQRSVYTITILSLFVNLSVALKIRIIKCSLSTYSNIPRAKYEIYNVYR